jgi:hypothetical protein
MLDVLGTKVGCRGPSKLLEATWNPPEACGSSVMSLEATGVIVGHGHGQPPAVELNTPDWVRPGVFLPPVRYSVLAGHMTSQSGMEWLYFFCGFCDQAIWKKQTTAAISSDHERSTQGSPWPITGYMETMRPTSAWRQAKDGFDRISRP